MANKEIVATLEKPYTENQRMGFIVEYNHNQGCEIEELETGSLQAFEMVKTDEEKLKQEKERIALLNMTGADVERAIYKVKGIDFDDILAMVKDNPKIDEKALKIEFKANNFFRGNPYIEQVGSLLGFTEEQLDKFFETKDYHYLTTCKLTINPTPENVTVTIIPEIIPYNTTAHYKVECEGYITKEGDIEMVKDEVLEVVLDENTTDTEQSTDVSNEVETKTTDEPNAN